MKQTIIMFIILISLFIPPVLGAGTSISVTLSPTTVNLYHDQSQQITLNIHNDNTYCSIQCYVYKDSVLQGTTNTISANDDEYYYISVTAPSSGSGSKTINIYVYCSEVAGWFCDSNDYDTWSGIITMNYGPSPEEQQQQSLRQQAEAEITTAENLINDAQSAINSAQSKITEASNVGADVTEANSYLSSANTELGNAQTYLATAQTSYNVGNYQSAKTSAQQAQTSANNAKYYANQAKSSAEQAMQQINKEKTEASNKISSASSAIDSARKSIKEAESLINNATIIGMDTTQAEADVATARSKLKSAEDYYSEATNAFDADNYELAKEKATSAESYAKEAESLATSAYNSLWVVYSKKSVAAQAITSADSEVSKMNEINTKLAYILRNMKTYGVDITETETVADEAASSTDEAEDLLSRAKNRMSAGYTEEAANLAVQARDEAASAYNRLDTIVLKLKFGIQDALDAAYKEKQSNLKQTQLEVQSASQTYGADNQLIIKAQEEVSDANTTLKDAKSKIDAIESSETLTELLTNAKAAFEALEQVQQQIDKAKADANAAKMKLYQTIATGAAAAGALGGGFLYWKRRKKKGKAVEKKPKKKKGGKK